MPKIADRRGKPIAITVEPARRPTAKLHAVAMHAHPLHRRHRRPARAATWSGAGCRRSSTTTAIDLVIANAENAAAGFGITREIGDQLLDCGVDVMTSGNHIWDKKEALDYIGAEPRLLRPANYPAGAPGNGSYLARTARRRDGRRRSTSWAACSC